MDSIASAYRRLLMRYEEEEEHIVKCFQGEMLDKYRTIICDEKNEVIRMMRTIY